MSTASPEQAFIGLGSNLGDRRRHLESAVEHLRAVPGVRVARVSRWLETDPVGGPPQGRFLNGAVEVECGLTARGLLERLQAIEAALGRRRLERWGPRTIDLDLLFFGRQVIAEPDLVVPHPLVLERRFVLEPLAEIAPGLVHPTTGRTVRDHLQALLAPAPSGGATPLP